MTFCYAKQYKGVIESRCGLLYLPLVMEKLFGSVFWDYSEKPLNLQGRICLPYSIYRGVPGLLLIYVLDPATLRLVQAWPLPAAAYVLAVPTGSCRTW